MQQHNYQNKDFKNGRSIKLLPILFVFVLLIVSFVVFYVGFDEELSPIKDYFLIPWTILTGAVISAPCIYLWYRGEFKLYNPIIFAACSYFIPAFFIGGLILSNGWSEPFFLTFIQDPQNDLPFTMIIVMLGFSGLTAGYFLPLGKIAGDKIKNVLPKWDWNTENLFTSGFVLLVIGSVNTVIGYVSGVLGYQKLEEVGIFDGILFLMTLMWMEASFLLWLVLFRRNKFDYKAVLTGSVLVITAFSKALYAGNRGGLLTIFIMIMLAFLLSGRKVTPKQTAIGISTLVLCLIVGMVYGTTFRNIKETETQIGMEQYTEHIFATFDVIISGENFNTLQQGFSNLAERLDAVSSLAVVTSNYEQLARYEEGYGLDNNIWKDTATFFIPRVIWNDKPLASEPRKYSELYFNYGNNSFTITPMGDLLRNFGVYGVFLGMMLLGVFLRFLYNLLIVGGEFSYWKTTIYFMLLTAISYESFYGAIMPYLSKVAVVSFIGLLVVNFIIKKTEKSNY